MIQNIATWIALFALLIGGSTLAYARPIPPDSEFIRVAADHWSFETSLSHKRFVPFGSNLVLTSKSDLNLFGPRYDSKRYDTILAACENLHINLLKVFLSIGDVLPDPQVPGKARIAPGYLDNLDSFLGLCRKHHIRAEIALTEWGGNNCKWWHEGGEYFGGRPWKNDPAKDSIGVLTSFWTTLCSRLKHNPTVFSYSPCVEWSFPSSNLTWFPAATQHGTLPSEPGIWYWRQWLLAKYKSLDSLNAAWGTDYRALRLVPIVDYTYSEKTHRYTDPDRKILDYQNFREWATLRYFRPQVAAIRAADPNHMVTISNHMRQWDLWEGAAMYFMGFTAFEEKPLVDYVTHHANYDEREHKTIENMLRCTVGMLRLCQAGKPMPVILEEFSYTAADPNAVAEVQARMVKATVGHASGWTTWYLQYPADPSAVVDSPDKTHQSSWLTPDLAPTPWGRKAASLYDELWRSDLRRQPGRATVKLDRAKELVPKELGTMLRLANQTDSPDWPVDYSLTHEPDLDIRLSGDE